jgi:L-ascorbate metabolism protein UlaG (beta-lactamase superfamily)
LKITLIGGPTALLEINGLRLLTDPTFDPPGTYQGTVTLTKTEGPAIRPDQLRRIDAVLLSHDQHWDNFDHSGRTFAATAPLVFTTQAGAQRLRQNAKPLAPWQSTTLGDLTITATPARHGPAGIEPISGEVTGFVLSIDSEPLVYITGDTVWHEAIAEVAHRFPVKVVLAFAGGAQARGPFYLTMDTNDVVETAHYFPHATIVPVHQHGWKHFTQSPSDLQKTFSLLKLENRLRTIQPGEAITLPL